MTEEMQKIRDELASKANPFISGTMKEMMESYNVRGAIQMSKKLTNRDRVLWKDGFNACHDLMQSKLDKCLEDLEFYENYW